MNTISVKMIAFCASVQSLIVKSGASVVQVLNNINSDLGKATLSDSNCKLGKTRLVKKDNSHRTGETVSSQFTGQQTIAIRFKAFNDSMAAIEKQFGATLELSEFPLEFRAWIAKAKPVTTAKPVTAKAKVAKPVTTTTEAKPVTVAS